MSEIFVERFLELFTRFCEHYYYTTVNSRYNEHGYIEIPVITKSVKFPKTS